MIFPSIMNYNLELPVIQYLKRTASYILPILNMIYNGRADQFNALSVINRSRVLHDLFLKTN